MSAQPQSSGRVPALTPARLIAGCCLLVQFVGALWVASYSRLTPRLLGFPFFYWYQLLWVVLGAALTGAAYLLVRADERARKRARRAARGQGVAVDLPSASAADQAPGDEGR